MIWALWAIVAAIIIYLVYHMMQSEKHMFHRPIDYLKKRYAKGEISKEEFELLRKEIEEEEKKII